MARTLGRERLLGGRKQECLLQHYDQQGIEVYRTDQDGAIVIKQRLDSLKTTIQATQEQFLSVVSGEGSYLRQEIDNLRRLWVKWTGGD